MLQYTATTMSPKTASTFRIEDDILDGLRTVKDRDGMPLSEQVRRALLMWLQSKDVKVKAERRRAGGRKRP